MSDAPASAAAAGAAPAAAAAAPAVAHADVIENPALLEQLRDQEEKSAEIAALRESLREYNEAHKAQVLVQQFLSSDRVVWRFLKARKFDQAAAAKLFQDAVAMRESQQLDTILQRPCPKGVEYNIVSRHGWHGFDMYGRPVFIKNTGWQNFPALNGTGTLEERVHYNLYLNEYLRQVIMPQANARIGKEGTDYIDQVTTIVNLRNFGWHCIKQHNYSWVKAIAAVNNTLYPESAGTTVIINAPRVFSMVWGIVKGWLDERTRAKVQILSGDGAEFLKANLGEECFRNLPKEIGGECLCIKDPKDVPQHGDPCMLGHPLSRAFMAHLRARNDEAGIPNVYNPPQPKEQEEAHLEQQQAAEQEGQ